MSFIVNNGGFDGSTNNIRIDFSNQVNEATASTPRYPVVPTSSYYYGDCDDPQSLPGGLGFPVPSNGVIEGGVPLDGSSTCSGDCHLLVVDKVHNWIYESYATNFNGNSVSSQCIVVWNGCHSYGLDGRGEQCTSVDAGGLSVTAGIVRPQEVESKNIDHALRFILPNTLIGKGTSPSGNQYVHPATHLGGPASSDPNAPLYGTIFRVKASFNTNQCFNSGDYNDPQWKVPIIAALKKYGAILTDGDGIPAFSLCFDRRFRYAGANGSFVYEYLGIEQRGLTEFCGLTASDFEVVAPPDYNPTTGVIPKFVYTGNCNRKAFPSTTCSSGTSKSKSKSKSKSHTKSKSKSHTKSKSKSKSKSRH
jgi:hypothetical protein